MANIGLSGILVIIIFSLIVFRPNILTTLGRAAEIIHKKVKKKFTDELEKK